MNAATGALTAAPDFDDARARAFAGLMLGALNGAALSLMASVGHRLALFDHLAATSPATVPELAARAGLSERYVREWLAVMTTSRVVEYDPQQQRFALPAEHAAFLTREGSVKNLAATAQFPSLMAGVEDAVIARFRDGRGLHYHDYPRFHEVMAEASYQTTVAPLVDAILPIVDGLIDRLDRGIDVADIGCGGGRALLALAERFPDSRFHGFDVCADAFAPAAEAARSRGLGNLRFSERDVAEGDLGALDLILAFDAVHDQSDPRALLQAVRQALRPGGVFLMVEFGASSLLEQNVAHPIAPFLYMMSTMHCTPISLGQGGAGLGAMWGVEAATEMLAEAGFGEVRLVRLPHDLFNAYFVASA